MEEVPNENAPKEDAINKIRQQFADKRKENTSINPELYKECELRLTPLSDTRWEGRSLFQDFRMEGKIAGKTVDITYLKERTEWLGKTSYYYTVRSCIIDGKKIFSDKAGKIVVKYVNIAESQTQELNEIDKITPDSDVDELLD